MRFTPDYFLLFFGFGCLFLYSCGVKNYPKETPFVYENKIEVVDPRVKGDSLTMLKDRLQTQLADSMQKRVKEVFVVFKTLIDPPAFDTAAARQSAANMEIYLKTIGYYNGKATYAAKFDTVTGRTPEKDQIRTTTTFIVNTGPVFRINEVDFYIEDSTLREISCSNADKSLLKPGTPFTEQLMVNEIDRLIDIYRNRGYYKISREQLYVDVDTVYLPLLNPLLDPFERILVLQEAQKRRENPLINVYIRTRPKIDSSVLTVYKVGEITVFPDYGGVTGDSITYKTTPIKHITIKSRQDKFKPSFLASNIFLQPDSLYKLSDLNRTIDNLNNLGTWQVIKVEPKEIHSFTPGVIDTPKIDFDFLMIPGKKYAFTADLESVFNQVQQAIIGTAGNLIGAGINLSLRNKNFQKQAIQSTNTLRFGVESGFGSFNPGLQAIEFTYGNSFSMPKLLLFNKNNFLFFTSDRWNKALRQKRTFINTNISYVNRNINNKGLFGLTNINSTMGWQVRTGVNEIITFQPLNIEYVRLYNLSDSFKVQLDRNPFLRFSFTPGLVMGMNFSYLKPRIVSRKRPNHIRYFRFGFEESGAIFGRFKSLVPILRNELFEYVKAEIEYKYQIERKKTVMIFRAVTGAGYLYGDTVSMPFFKQFTGGGPNSMRAWPLRSIGPGARPQDPRANRGQFFSRSGDFIFEANAEFRYDIVTVIPNTFVLRGALFTDIGNIWNFRNKSNTNNDTVVLKLKNLYRDLSVSAGTGFRLDFVGLFVLRFDFGLRIKNPALPFSNTNSGWRIPVVNLANLFSNKEANRQWRYENFNFSLGINYPF
jgi:outer membrane protein insertion porin family